jgi:hypothetical protein
LKGEKSKPDATIPDYEFRYELRGDPGGRSRRMRPCQSGIRMNSLEHMDSTIAWTR